MVDNVCAGRVSIWLRYSCDIRGRAEYPDDVGSERYYDWPDGCNGPLWYNFRGAFWGYTGTEIRKEKIFDMDCCPVPGIRGWFCPCTGGLHVNGGAIFRRLKYWGFICCGTHVYI